MAGASKGQGSPVIFKCLIFRCEVGRYFNVAITPRYMRCKVCQARDNTRGRQLDGRNDKTHNHHAPPSPASWPPSLLAVPNTPCPHSTNVKSLTGIKSRLSARLRVENRMHQQALSLSPMENVTTGISCISAAQDISGYD